MTTKTKNKGFVADDIDAMFAGAVSAAEDTGEGNVGGKETVTKTQAAKPEQAPKPEVKKTEPVKPKPEPKPEPVVKPAPEPVKKAEPARRTPAAFDVAKGVSEVSISKILGMNNTFNKFNESQQDFVTSYFQVEDGDDLISKVIYKALTASERDLDALGNIVKAKGAEPAERAFFLIGLENNEVRDVYEQVDLLTGELGEAGEVTERNKLNVCRKIESVIANTEKSLFSYIEKLQEFTAQAIK